MRDSQHLRNLNGDTTESSTPSTPTGQPIKADNTVFLRTLSLLSRVSPGLMPRFLKGGIRGWYQLISMVDKQANVTFMNYGYAPLDPNDSGLELRPEDVENRYCAQLYHRVAGAVELHDKDVLEVGCGRGGGTSFVMRYLEPRAMTGIDFAAKAVAFCRRHHPVLGLSFSQGDAENLPFPDSSFDVVLNVESSHCYPSMERFLQEVVRVLRPQGYFLFADFRRRDRVEPLREHLRQSGLTLITEEKITPNVLRALDLDNERKRDIVDHKTPMLMRRTARRFAGLKDTPVYESFRTEELTYLRFVLQK